MNSETVRNILIKIDTAVYKEQSSKCEFRENRPRDTLYLGGKQIYTPTC